MMVYSYSCLISRSHNSRLLEKGGSSSCSGSFGKSIVNASFTVKFDDLPGREGNMIYGEGKID